VVRIYTHLPGRSFLILDVNALTGPIPSELGLLPKLTDIGLRKSFLSFYLFNLCYKYKLTCLDDFLDLVYKGLTGPIPSELGSLTNLDGFFLRKLLVVILLLLTCATNMQVLPAILLV
jgi:hypothetical protein